MVRTPQRPSPQYRSGPQCAQHTQLNIHHSRTITHRNTDHTTHTQRTQNTTNTHSTLQSARRRAQHMHINTWNAHTYMGTHMSSAPTSARTHWDASMRVGHVERSEVRVGDVDSSSMRVGYGVGYGNPSVASACYEHETLPFEKTHAAHHYFFKHS